MSSERLAGEIREIAQHLASTHAKLLAKIAEADRAEAWRYDGASSSATWLVARLGVSHRTGRSWTETAERLTELPEAAAAFASGDLSYDQIRALCRFSTPATDLDDLEEARWSSVDRLHRIARERERIEIGSLETAHRRRFLKWHFDVERRCLVLRGEIPDDQGAVIVEALERIGYTTPHDPDLGVYQGFWPRAADALYELASQSLGADHDPDRATLVVHVDADVLATDDSGVGIAQDGPALHNETIRRLACDSRWQIVVDGDDDIPIGIGRTSRSIPAWLMRQLLLRDGGCRFPGCGRRRWVHAHHIIHWARGGRTDLDNLILLCGYHHRILHEQGWRISGGPNAEVTWIRPDNTPYTPTFIEEDLARYADGMLKQAIRGAALTDTS
ncbi:MAG: DUF222 domain-containing protein [Actinomycetota bacterium]